SWLQERGVALAPVRRLLSLSVALFAAILGFGLLAGALSLPGSYSFVIFGVQLFFVLAWTVALRPPGPWVVAVIGVAAAAGADLAAVLPTEASLAPLGYVTVAGFVFGVLGQLLRGAGRQGVTESLGATLAVVVGVVAFAALLVLDRHPLGTRSIVACLSAALAAIMADLAVSYAEAGRELDGERSALWIARHLQGPLGGFALAAPAAYVLSVLVLVPGF